LTASLAMETKEQLQQKLLELDQRHKEEEEKLMMKMKKQEKRLGDQEKMLGEQEKKLGEHDKISLLEKEFRVKWERELQVLKKTFQEFEQKVSIQLLLNRRFEMRNASLVNKINDWKSPALYTHVGGYKFCVGVKVNEGTFGRQKHIRAGVWSVPGEFDDQLKWPAGASFTLEFINQQGEENTSRTVELEWNHPHQLNLCIQDIPSWVLG